MSRLGTGRRRIQTHPLRTRLQHRRLTTGLRAEQLVLTKGVDTRISRHDAMYVGDGGHYFSVGLSAIVAVDKALAACGARPPVRILDMPCGHGRVLRFLATRFPDAELTACDLDTNGARFCAERFRARPFESQADVAQLELPGPFDLIWCGSLATHIPAKDVQRLLQLFADSLRPEGGVAVVTTHGDLVADRLRSGAADYQLDGDAVRTAVDGFDARGFGYADYAWSPGYGVSISSREWIEHAAGAADLRVAHFAEHAWDGHQDVVALVPA